MTTKNNSNDILSNKTGELGKKISKSTKKSIYQKLKDNTYTYGSIPYEIFSKDLDLYNLVSDGVDSASENIGYLYDLITKKVYNSERVQEIIQIYINQYLKTGDVSDLVFHEDNDEDIILKISPVDDFPDIEIELYEKEKNTKNNIITIVYPLYGIETKSKTQTVKKIFENDVETYKSFYNRWNLNLARNFVNLLISKNLIFFAKYNKKPSKIPNYGVTNIYNLPFLANKISNMKNTSFNDLTTIIINQPINRPICLSKSLLITKTLKKQLDDDKYKLLINTEANISSFLSEDDVEKGLSKLKNHIVDDPYALIPNDIIISLFNNTHIKAYDSISLQQQLKNLLDDKLEPSLNRFIVNVEKIPPEISMLIDNSDIYYYFYMSARGLVPYQTQNPKAYMLLKIYLQDFGIPSNDEKNPNPMQPRFIRYVDEFINNIPFEQDLILDICTQIGLQQYHEIIDWTILKQILIKGHIKNLPFENEFLQRYEEWKLLTEHQRVLMKAVYKISFINAHIFCNFPKIQKNAEKIIKSFDGNNLKEIMEIKLKMIVPESTDRMDYFIDTLPLYLEFINRDKKFDPADEIELIETLEERGEKLVTKGEKLIKKGEQIEGKKLIKEGQELISRTANMVEEIQSFYKKCSDVELCYFFIGGLPAHKNRQNLLDIAFQYIKGEEMLLYVRPQFDDVMDKDKNKETRETLYLGLSRAPTNNKYNLSFSYVNNKSNFDFSLEEFSMMNAAYSSGETLGITNINSIIVTDGEEVKIGRLAGDIDFKRIALSKKMEENFIKVFSEMQFYFQRKINEAFDRGDFITTATDGTKEENKDFYFTNNKGVKVLHNINKDLKMRPAKIRQVDEEDNEEDDYYIIWKSIILLEKVNNIYKDIEMRLKITNQRDLDYWNQFRNYSKEVQNHILDMLVMLFDTGMYQRQWKGKRGEYPMSASQTGTEYDYYKNMKKTKEELVGDSIAFIMEKIDFLNKKFPDLDAANFFGNLICMLPDARAEAANWKNDMNIEGNNWTIALLLNKLGRGDTNSSNYVNDSINQLQKNINDLQNDINQINLTIKETKDTKTIKKSKSKITEKTDEINNINVRITTIKNNVKKSEIASEMNSNVGHCIRVGSTQMIYTGYYYLRIFDSVKKLDKFEFWKLDPIS